MTKWNSEMPDSTREGDIKYVENRWSQLSEFETLFANDAIKYLFLANSGGAVAVLTFIGTAESIRAQNWPWIVLAFFAAGVICVGLLHGIRYREIVSLFKLCREFRCSGSMPNSGFKSFDGLPQRGKNIKLSEPDMTILEYTKSYSFC